MDVVGRVDFVWIGVTFEVVQQFISECDVSIVITSASMAAARFYDVVEFRIAYVGMDLRAIGDANGANAKGFDRQSR